MASRLGLFCLAAIVAAVAVTTDPADARHRRKRYHVKRAVRSEVVRPRVAIEAPKARTERRTRVRQVATAATPTS